MFYRLFLRPDEFAATPTGAPGDAGEDVSAPSDDSDAEGPDVPEQAEQSLLAGAEAASASAQPQKATAQAAMPAKMPEQFQLTRNYRATNTIVRVAHSIVVLIRHFAPASIDALAPEQSAVRGEVPIFLTPGSDSDPVIQMFQSGSSLQGGCR